MIIGIDPGKSGSLILMDRDGALVDLADFVTVKVGKKNTLAIPLIANYIRLNWIKHHPITYIEQVHAMPKQGVSSSFDFGFSTGVAHGIFAAHGGRIETITPQAWLKVTGIGTGKGKDAARLWAINKWPDQANWFERKKDQGRADAAAIAWAGLQLEKSNGK